MSIEMSVATVRKILVAVVSEISGIAAHEIDLDTPLEHYGINSTMIAELNQTLEDKFPGLPSTVFFEYRNLRLLSDYIVTEHKPMELEPASADKIPTDKTPIEKPPAGNVIELQHGSARVGETLDGDRAGVDWQLEQDLPLSWFTAPAAEQANADIAVIGMAGTYPDARNLDEFWQNLLTGKDSIRDVPSERWDVEPWFDTDVDRDDRVYSRWGGFIEGIDQFDARFFNLSPREAKRMDPQERLFLQTAWQGFEQAGYSAEQLKGSRTGVFVGAMWSLYQLYGAERTAIGTPDIASSSFASIANRLSWFMDLKGPSLSIDSMCSSSLTALHLARLSVLRGECEQALVGGVNITSHPAKYIHLSRGGFASKDGRCRAFGDGGTGYVPGEGVGVVLLKSLEAAMRDKDQVLAVIKATAANHGGRTHGYTVPDPAGQADCLISALTDSGCSSSAVRYVEAHGTGTSLGDPIEMAGMLKCYAPRETVLRIGSVKTNIGHAESAAGIAGLHKLILQIKHNTLAPSLHADVLNGNIQWDRIPVRVQTQAEPFTLGANEAMGLSAFGAGGSNAHVIVAAPPILEEAHWGEDSAYPVLVSAQSEEALQAQINTLHSYLTSVQSSNSLASISYTLMTGRTHFACRTVFIADSKEMLLQQLANWPAEDSKALSAERTPSGPVDRLPDATVVTLYQWLQGQTNAVDTLWSCAVPVRVGLPGYRFDTQRYWLDAPLPPQGVHAVEQVFSAKGVSVAPLQNDVRMTLEDSMPASLSVSRSKWQMVGDLLPLHGQEQQVGSAVPQRILCHESQRELALHTAAALGCKPHVVCCTDTLDIDQALKSSVDILDIRVTDVNDQSNVLQRLRLLMWQLRAKGSIRYLMLGLRQDHHRALDSELVRLLPAEYSRLTASSVSCDSLDVDTIVLLWHTFVTQQLEPARRYRLSAKQLSVQLYEPNGVMGSAYQLNPDAWHVITGGTGGIGLAVARLLCERGARHLVLTGRQALPERSTWRSVIDDASADAGLRHKLRQLDALPAEVSLVQWPLHDIEQLSVGIAQLVDIRPIGTVVHLAGSVDMTTPAFIDKSPESIESVITGKCKGALNLQTVLMRYTADRLLLMSSQCASFPALAVGVMDYAAANAALMSMAENVFEPNGIGRVQTLLLPNWIYAGLGATESEHHSRLGLIGVDEAEGLALIETAMDSDDAVLLAASHDASFDLLLAQSITNRRQTSMKSDRSHSTIAAVTDYSETEAMTSVQTNDTDRLVACLTERFAAVLELEPGDWLRDDRFADLGVDSILLTRLSRQLEMLLGCPVAADLLISHDTLGRLAEWMQQVHPGRLSFVGAAVITDTQQTDESTLADTPVIPTMDELAQGPVITPKEVPANALMRSGTQSGTQSGMGLPSGNQSKTYHLSVTEHTPAIDRQAVAVVGIGTLTPGADTLDAFWKNLLNGVDCIREVPEARWSHAQYYGHDGPFTSPSKWGGFIDGIEFFDPTRYALPATMGASADPLLRVALWATHAAICDAGLSIKAMDGSQTGVFIGSRVANWADRLPAYERHTVLGTAQNFIAAHLSHWLNLCGPSVVLDTACSSSLYAIHQACRSLAAGDCEMALAGGSEVLLDERPYLMLGKTGALSPTGRCRTFDAEADGFVPGEGGVMVVLKQLHQALIDGDRIYCVIEGTAVNNDGRTMGVTTPNPDAQQAVIEQAMARAACEPSDIGYIEAHGTGTALGDPMELKSLTRVFQQHTTEQQFCGVGSVKSSMGHLLSAAGAAAFAKTALCLHQQTLVPTLHCHVPNPRFQFSDSPFYPVTSRRNFEAVNGVRRAGVSAFGFGGTNVHIQLSDRHLQMAYQPARIALPPPDRGGPYAWYQRSDQPLQSAASAIVDDGFKLISNSKVQYS